MVNWRKYSREFTRLFNREKTLLKQRKDLESKIRDLEEALQECELDREQHDKIIWRMYKEENRGFCSNCAHHHEDNFYAKDGLCYPCAEFDGSYTYIDEFCSRWKIREAFK